jgi:hypothetical protein
MDLAGLLMGLAVAFRLSAPAGAVVSGIIGTAPTLSRIIGGLLLFLAVGGAAAIGAHYLHRLVHRPGLALTNRVSGAGLAVAWGGLMVTLILSVVSLLRLPPALATRLDESAVATALTEPGGLPQSMFRQLSGDRIIGVLLRLDEISAGDRLILDEDEMVEIAPAQPEELAPDDTAASYLFEGINESRRHAGVDGVQWDNVLATKAVEYALEMYGGGYLGHRDREGGGPADRVPGRWRVGENLALAVDANEADAGLNASPTHHATRVAGAYGRVGVAAVQGPSGLLVVEVFSG